MSYHGLTPLASGLEPAARTCGYGQNISNGAVLATPQLYVILTTVDPLCMISRFASNVTPLRQFSRARIRIQDRRSGILDRILNLRFQIL